MLTTQHFSHWHGASNGVQWSAACMLHRRQQRHQGGVVAVPHRRKVHAIAWDTWGVRQQPLKDVWAAQCVQVFKRAQVIGMGMGRALPVCMNVRRG